MFEVTLKELSAEHVLKLRETFMELSSKHASEWVFPAGDSKVTLRVEGPTHRRESEILQYAIDILEVAKKHATD